MEYHYSITIIIIICFHNQLSEFKQLTFMLLFIHYCMYNGVIQFYLSKSDTNRKGNDNKQKDK